jgi:hypothetical protein
MASIREGEDAGENGLDELPAARPSRLGDGADERVEPSGGDLAQAERAHAGVDEAEGRFVGAFGTERALAHDLVVPPLGARVA